MSRFSSLVLIALTFVGSFRIAPSDVSAQAIDGTDAEAHGLFDAGTAAFDDGRFEEAYGYFTHAYTLSRRAELLFNIASACERLRRDREAIGHYQGYLAAIPDAPNRRFVEGRLRFLSAAAQVDPTSTGSREPPPHVENDPGADAPTATPSPELAPSGAALASAIATPDAAASRSAPLQPAPRAPHRHRRALIWTGVGVVVAAAVATGLAVSLRDPGVQAPIAGDVGPGGILIALVRDEARR